MTELEKIQAHLKEKNRKTRLKIMEENYWGHKDIFEELGIRRLGP